jgi:hypothetical protein
MMSKFELGRALTFNFSSKKINDVPCQRSPRVSRKTCFAGAIYLWITQRTLCLKRSA